MSTTKLDPALLSFRITYIIPIPQMSARKLSWASSGWKQQFFCSGALKQGIHISGLEELFFLYLPKENKAWVLPHTSCHPHNQTLWLNCLAQTEFKHWTLNLCDHSVKVPEQVRWTLHSFQGAEAGAPHQPSSKGRTASSCLPRTLLLAAMPSWCGTDSPKPPLHAFVSWIFFP